MISSVRLYPAEEIKPLVSLQALQQKLLRFAFLNLLIVALIGLLLRATSLLLSVPFDYKNLLHGHSHFAFVGWVFPILMWMMLHYFPQLQEKISFQHWRNVSVMTLVAAYGILISFPVQGYGAVSIVFSTLSVLASYYLAAVVLKATKKDRAKTSIKFLRAALWFAVLSSIGPFATGPIVAMGKGGTPLYHNAIYFYLHFQYNGFFTFTVLAVLYALLGKNGVEKNGNTVFKLFASSFIPAYFLSVLWNGPSPIFYVIGGAAALMQVIACIYLIKDFGKLQLESKFAQWLFTLAMFAFALKNVLQLASAFPIVANLAYHSRNFIIAYLHLVLLGFISLFAFAAIVQANNHLITSSFKKGILLFLFAFIATETLLLLNAMGLATAFYNEQLVVYSSLLPSRVIL